MNCRYLRRLSRAGRAQVHVPQKPRYDAGLVMGLQDPLISAYKIRCKVGMQGTPAVVLPTFRPFDCRNNRSTYILA